MSAAAMPLTACADDGAAIGATSTAAPAAPGSRVEVVTVRIQRSRFSAPELRISLGTTVRFVNDDAFAHTVTSRDGAPSAFDSGELAEGETFEVAFDDPGEYAYFCRIHPTMRASVIVE